MKWFPGYITASSLPDRKMSQPVAAALRAVSSVQTKDDAASFYKDNVPVDLFYFHDDNLCFNVDNFSGGQLDCLLTFMGFHHQPEGTKFKAPIVFLDEPGQNVGAAERLTLREYLRPGDRQVILITHHVELFDTAEFDKNVIMRVVIGDRPGTDTIEPYTASVVKKLELDFSRWKVTLPSQFESKTKFMKYLFSNVQYLPLLFCLRALLVEGFTDVRLLEALFGRLLTHEVIPDKHESAMTLRIQPGLRLFNCAGFATVEILAQVCSSSSLYLHSSRVLMPPMSSPHKQFCSRAADIRFLAIRDSDIMFEPTEIHKKMFSGSAEQPYLTPLRKHSSHLICNIVDTRWRPAFQDEVLQAVVVYFEAWCHKETQQSASKLGFTALGIKEALKFLAELDDGAFYIWYLLLILRILLSLRAR
jgi:hypothetical protein